MTGPPLTPAQEEVLAVLRARGQPRPSFDSELRPRLRARLESELAAVAAVLDRPVIVSKTGLAQVHACEAHQVAEAAVPFAWSVATARGTLVHKAIELSVHWRGPRTPLDLVDDALSRLEYDSVADVGTFLRTQGEAERAELRSAANDAVGKFLESWPPLGPSWVPRSESRLRAELCEGLVVLSGKVDLSLGSAAGTQAGRLVVDLKTGGSFPGHLDDLRFYALLETLRLGVPPFRLATYYLDSGTFSADDVTEDVLEAAVRRTVAGVTKIIELRGGLRSPAVTPNPACRWCHAREGCDGARQWATSTEEW